MPIYKLVTGDVMRGSEPQPQLAAHYGIILLLPWTVRYSKRPKIATTISVGFSYQSSHIFTIDVITSGDLTKG